MVGGVNINNHSVTLNITNEQVQNSATPEQSVISTDMQGAPKTGTGSISHTFTMPAPKADAASLMLALTSLQKNIAEISMNTVATAIEGLRDEIGKLNEKRAEELKKYFENMEKSIQPKKTGLFGLVFKFFKAVCMAPFVPLEQTKAAFSELGELAKNSIRDIVKDLLNVAAVVASIAIAVGTFGGGGPLAIATIALVVGASVASTTASVLSDPGIQDEILSGKSPEEQDRIKKNLSIASYVFMGISVACSIASVCTGFGAMSAVKQAQAAKDAVGAAKTAVETTASVAGRASNLAILAEASEKFVKVASYLDMGSRAVSTSLQVAAVGVKATSDIYGGFVTGYNAVKNSDAAEARADAATFSAQGDRTLANIAEIEKELDVRMELLKDFLALQEKMLESTSSMLTQTMSGAKAAASA